MYNTAFHQSSMLASQVLDEVRNVKTTVTDNLISMVENEDKENTDSSPPTQNNINYTGS